MEWPDLEAAASSGRMGPFGGFRSRSQYTIDHVGT